MIWLRAKRLLGGSLIGISVFKEGHLQNPISVLQKRSFEVKIAKTSVKSKSKETEVKKKAEEYMQLHKSSTIGNHREIFELKIIQTKPDVDRYSQLELNKHIKAIKEKLSETKEPKKIKKVLLKECIPSGRTSSMVAQIEEKSPYEHKKTQHNAILTDKKNMLVKGSHEGDFPELKKEHFKCSKRSVKTIIAEIQGNSSIEQGANCHKNTSISKVQKMISEIQKTESSRANKVTKLIAKCQKPSTKVWRRPQKFVPALNYEDPEINGAEFQIPQLRTVRKIKIMKRVRRANENNTAQKYYKRWV